MSDGDKKAWIDLRILATTDLHMNLLPYDYFSGRSACGIGLAGLAPLIEEERVSNGNNLLFDNGDFLQGTPLGDFLAEGSALAPSEIHPMIAAMNALGYDAITPGNHDFAFGPGYFLDTLKDANFGVCSANLRLIDGPIVPASLLLARTFVDRSGESHLLNIGVVGVLPSQTTDWDVALRKHLTISDMAEAVQRETESLRAQGADLIVLLAHSGIGAAEYTPRMENAATALAAIAGVDVVIAGHTHLVFPAIDFPLATGIDPVRGTLAGKPAVMAGFWGSHLGVIDLALCHDGLAWQLAASSSRARPAEARRSDPHLAQLAQPAHRATQDHFSREITRSQTDLHSFFALLGQDAGVRLVMAAQRWHAQQILQGTTWDGVPILSASSPARAGGRGGPAHYTDVAAGPLSLRHLADLYLFPNRLNAICVSGAEVSDWLERAASKFLRLRPGATDQPLIDPDFPGYNFDVIEGLRWQIDLAKAPRYSPSGELISPESRRITALRHAGRKVEPDDRFLLVTNSYRLSATGLFAPLTQGKQVVLSDGERIRDILRRYITQLPRIEPAADCGWSFAPLAAPSSIFFETSPRARAHLSQIAHFYPEDMGETEAGFLKLRLHL